MYNELKINDVSTLYPNLDLKKNIVTPPKNP